MKNARLILVEDDPFTRATLGDALALHGFDVRARIGTAIEAIEAQQKHDPQVALLDLDLGIGASGIDLAIALRKKNPKIGIFTNSFLPINTEVKKQRRQSSMQTIIY